MILSAFFCVHYCQNVVSWVYDDEKEKYYAYSS